MEPISVMERDCSAIGSLFQVIINDMKAGNSNWDDFIIKATKFHSQLKATIIASTAFLDSFQKIADMATSTRGGTKDIGSSLTRLCLRHRSVEAKLKTYTSSLMECLVIPLQDRLEEWKKTTQLLDKDHAKEIKRLRQELKKRHPYDIGGGSTTLKLQKKLGRGSHSSITGMLSKSMESVEGSEKLFLLEEMEKKSLRRALIEERSRFCLFVNFVRPVVEEELSMLHDVNHLQEIMDHLMHLTSDPYILPSASENVIADCKLGTHTAVAENPAIKNNPNLRQSSPPSSPSSFGSRKSSMCSISSFNSNSSDGSHSPTRREQQRRQHQRNSHTRYRSLSQLNVGSSLSHSSTSSGSTGSGSVNGVHKPLRTLGPIRMLSISSQDSGFLSHPDHHYFQMSGSTKSIASVGFPVPRSTQSPTPSSNSSLHHGSSVTLTACSTIDLRHDNFLMPPPPPPPMPLMSVSIPNRECNSILSTPPSSCTPSPPFLPSTPPEVSSYSDASSNANTIPAAPTLPSEATPWAEGSRPHTISVGASSTFGDHSGSRTTSAGSLAVTPTGNGAGHFVSIKVRSTSQESLYNRMSESKKQFMDELNQRLSTSIVAGGDGPSIPVRGTQSNQPSVPNKTDSVRSHMSSSMHVGPSSYDEGSSSVYANSNDWKSSANDVSYSEGSITPTNADRCTSPVNDYNSPSGPLYDVSTLLQHHSQQQLHMQQQQLQQQQMARSVIRTTTSTTPVTSLPPISNASTLVMGPKTPTKSSIPPALPTRNSTTTCSIYASTGGIYGSAANSPSRDTVNPPLSSDTRDRTIYASNGTLSRSGSTKPPPPPPARRSSTISDPNAITLGTLQASGCQNYEQVQTLRKRGSNSVSDLSIYSNYSDTQPIYSNSNNQGSSINATTVTNNNHPVKGPSSGVEGIYGSRGDLTNQRLKLQAASSASATPTSSSASIVPVASDINVQTRKEESLPPPPPEAYSIAAGSVDPVRGRSGSVYNRITNVHRDFLQTLNDKLAMNQPNPQKPGMSPHMTKRRSLSVGEHDWDSDSGIVPGSGSSSSATSSINSTSNQTLQQSLMKLMGSSSNSLSTHIMSVKSNLKAAPVPDPGRRMSIPSSTSQPVASSSPPSSSSALPPANQPTHVPATPCPIPPPPLPPTCVSSPPSTGRSQAGTTVYAYPTPITVVSSANRPITRPQIGSSQLSDTKPPTTVVESKKEDSLYESFGGIKHPSSVQSEMAKAAASIAASRKEISSQSNPSNASSPSTPPIGGGGSVSSTVVTGGSSTPVSENSVKVSNSSPSSSTSSSTSTPVGSGGRSSSSTSSNGIENIYAATCIRTLDYSPEGADSQVPATSSTSECPFPSAHPPTQKQSGVNSPQRKGSNHSIPSPALPQNAPPPLSQQHQAVKAVNSTSSSSGNSVIRAINSSNSSSTVNQSGSVIPASLTNYVMSGLGKRGSLPTDVLRRDTSDSSMNPIGSGTAKHHDPVHRHHSAGNVLAGALGSFEQAFTNKVNSWLSSGNSKSSINSPPTSTGSTHSSNQSVKDPLGSGETLMDQIRRGTQLKKVPDSASGNNSPK